MSQVHETRRIVFATMPVWQRKMHCSCDDLCMAMTSPLPDGAFARDSHMVVSTRLGGLHLSLASCHLPVLRSDVVFRC